MTPKGSAFCLVTLLFVCFNCKCNQASNSNLSKEEELEIEAQLKLLNKPFIKTFQTEEGDIIDCVDINKQPALDHPLLKNHKVQTRLSRYVLNSLKDSSQSKYKSSFNNREACPAGFIPIRRTLKQDLIRLRSLSSNKQEARSRSSNNPETDYSDDYFLDTVNFPSDLNVVSLSLEKGRKYYAAQARFAVYNLSVAIDQSSSSNIWVVGGPSDDSFNVILAGWQVNPKVNGDSLTRLFVYWTVDGGVATGCHNMFCQGFVQVHRSISPGTPFSLTSTYQGTQYDYSFTILQESERWWVVVGDHQEALGYWPNELLPYLLNGADQLAWGGIAKPTSDGIQSPPLGNGHKPNGQYNEGCYIRDIRYFNSDKAVEAIDFHNALSYVSNTKCYDLIANQNCGNDMWKYCFTYGGPGGTFCSSKN